MSAPPTPNSALQNTTTDSSGTTGTETNASDTNTNSASSASTASSIVEKSIQPKVSAPHIEFSIPKIATTGIPVPIVYTVYDARGDIRYYGSMHIAFGDGTEYGGSSKDETSHIYQSAGTYIVKLDYRSNPYVPKPDLTARATIIVSNPSVSISEVTEDDSIVLANTSSNEADISGWIVTASLGQKKTDFYIPSGTIIAPKATVTLPSSVVGFLGDAPTITLSLPLHTHVSTYALVAENELPETLVQAVSLQREFAPTIEPLQKIPEAKVGIKSASIEDPAETKKQKSIFWYALFLLGVIACSVYSFLRFVGIKKMNGDTPIVLETHGSEKEGENHNRIDVVRIVEE